MKKMKTFYFCFLVQLTFGFAQEKFEISSAKISKEINVEYADSNR
jgi:hypothetical protein